MEFREKKYWTAFIISVLKYLLPVIIVIFFGCVQRPAETHDDSITETPITETISAGSAPGDEQALIPETPTKIEYTGGDGTSMAQAVVITGAPNGTEGVRAERKWINCYHPGWRKTFQALYHCDNKYYDEIEYTLPTGETKTIYFDITEFFGK